MAAPNSLPGKVRQAPVLKIPSSRRSRKWKWIAGISAFILVVIAVCVRIVILRAEPILRTRVIETLSTRFKSQVALAEIHVWVGNGIHVDGKGLKIFGATDPNPWEAGVQPLIEINEFNFQTSLRNLFREPMRVETVYVSGLTLNIPPHNERSEMSSLGKTSKKISIAVDHFQCTDTRLLINTTKPGKPPLEFDISNLGLKDIGPGLPLQFQASLINPKPIGDIKSTGQFGPLNGQSPRDSAVEGSYSFNHADLDTFNGLDGILSSTGKYSGTLGHIVVDGETDIPDFRLSISGHRVALHTDFHAVVDGTDGDTYLEPVKARFLRSSFTASGKVVRAKDRGHDIELNIAMEHARIEDLLTLGVRTEPPVLAGNVSMRTKLSLPPGSEAVQQRLGLQGSFHIPDGTFSNEKVQTRIDSLSLRSQGKPKLAKTADESPVRSDLQGTFKLKDGVLSFSFLHFQVPGTHADMTGQYSLDGNIYDFHGTLRMQAKLSQMTTGWKSILLKPVDPFFEKKGAGTQLPFKVTGTREAPRFGLDFNRKGDASEPPPHTSATR